MHTKKIFFCMAILSILSLTACQIPVQVIQVTQPASQVQQAKVQDDTAANLIGTMAVMETKLAAISTLGTPPAFTDTPPSTLTPTTTNTVIPTSVTQTLAANYLTPGTPVATTTPCNRAAYKADLTIPDGTHVDTGDSFTKTWRLVNNGTCTWTTGYNLVFDHGDLMGGPVSVPLPMPVYPGGTVDLSVYLIAPLNSGSYQGYWMLQDPNGVKFGIGADASVPFWVKISAGNFKPDAPEIFGSCRLMSVSPDLFTSFNGNTEIAVKWTVKNTGNTTWSKDDVKFRYISGARLYKDSDNQSLSGDVPPGEMVDVIVNSMTPAGSGNYSTAWGVVNSSTGSRLCVFTVTVKVN